MTEEQEKELEVLQARLVKHEAEFTVLRKKFNGKCRYLTGLRKKVLKLECDKLFEDGITIKKGREEGDDDDDIFDDEDDF